MTGTFLRRAEPSARRTMVPTLAIAGFGAIVAIAAAVPASAVAAAPHHAASAHHAKSKHHDKRLLVKGLVAHHHGRTVTVFAKTAKVGTKTRHNGRIRVKFARTAHSRSKLRTGDHIRLSAMGSATKHTFTIRHDMDETITAEPATLFFGTVKAVNANLLTVVENDRDNGDHHDGDDNDGDKGGDHDGITSPADHGGGGGDGDNEGHQITIDDTAATVTVDGAAGTIAVGDTVAVLGESTDNTVVASTIYAFTTTPSFMRGKVQQVTGDNVTLREDGNTFTVSLTGVPLAVNGDVGAAPSQLMVGDKLLLVGPLNSTTGQVMPAAAFAFNHHDDNPCGDNDQHGDGGNDG